MEAGNEDKKTVVRFTVGKEISIRSKMVLMLIKYCQQCDREVTLINEKNGRAASGDSIIDIFGLDAEEGSRFRVEVEGDDEIAREIAETISRNLTYGGSWS